MWYNIQYEHGAAAPPCTFSICPFPVSPLRRRYLPFRACWREAKGGATMDVTTNSTGSLKISRDVIASIAGCTATEIEGVAALAPLTSGLTSGWVFKARSSRPVAVGLNDDVASIDINVDLASGARIPEVSSKIQQAVKDAVQNMTGVAVTKVNVHVAGLVFPAAPAEV